MKVLRSALLFILVSNVFQLNAQHDSLYSYEGIASRIFLPSLDIGFINPNSSLISTAYLVKTSVEYRIRNNNDYFLRLTYNTFGSKYKLNNATTTNTIEGTAQITDVFLAPGYRFGDKHFRFMIAYMPGIRFYEYPTATLNGNNILLEQKAGRLFTTSALGTLEIYFDEKSAITFSYFHNQVWKNIDFWAEGRNAFGCSIGFITSLI
ncbi:MAG: hypothetical protein JXQ87_15685 [Bacteroidia bacterium]